jgi:hypothetical protein
MLRIRHCVECPKCLTRYVISFSPYRNGSYLIPTMNGSSEEYALYCSCRRTGMPTRWKWSEVMACEVSKAAYKRGYGTPDEILQINPRRDQVRYFDVSRYDVSRYFDRWKPMEKRKSSV